MICSCLHVNMRTSGYLSRNVLSIQLMLLYMNSNICRELTCVCVQLFACLYVADECSDLISQERVVGSVATPPHFYVRVGSRPERSRVWQMAHSATSRHVIPVGIDVKMRRRLGYRMTRCTLCSKIVLRHYLT